MRIVLKNIIRYLLLSTALFFLSGLSVSGKENSKEYVTQFTGKLEETINMRQEIKSGRRGFDTGTAEIENVYDTEAFKEHNTYQGNDLGAIYEKEKTAFRVWAPTAGQVEVLLYQNGDTAVKEEPEAYTMERAEQGTWFLEIQGDLRNRFYTYRVMTGESTVEAIDPYAKGCGINGMRGQIVDLRSTDPENFSEDAYRFNGSPVDAVIYELHVRDLSTYEDSGIVNVGKFKGLTERGTTTSDGVVTGLDHMKELGITHVQLLPVADQQSVDEKNSGNTFNWGYDPLNYNIPEGSYASDAYDGNVRIREMKEMIQALHNEGIGVIMDVVYNHTANSADSNFNRIVPGYYYRMTSQGNFSNGSACGNETASEREMMRKFIIDSVTYLVLEYHIDGFRFDLMGLHDIETMNAIRKALDEINPGILLYGEGWHAGGAGLSDSELALKKNAAKLDSHIGLFSDDIRDGIKGSVFDARQPGYINGNPKRTMDIRFGITASTKQEGINIFKVSMSNTFWAMEPTQTVTYASCHDNYTLWDKLKLTNPEAGEAELVAMNKLSAAIVLTSQGIPFFQAGEEIGRSKKGEDNSYKSSDSINQINWSDKAERMELFRYYQGLIALRKEYPLFRLQTASDIQKALSFAEESPDTVVAYSLQDTENHLFVVLNGSKEEHEISLPDKGWDVLVDGEKAGTEVLYSVGNKLKVNPQSAYVLHFTGKTRLWEGKGIALTLLGVGAVAAAAGSILIKKLRRKS